MILKRFMTLLESGYFTGSTLRYLIYMFSVYYRVLRQYIINKLVIDFADIRIRYNYFCI